MCVLWVTAEEVFEEELVNFELEEEPDLDLERRAPRSCVFAGSRVPAGTVKKYRAPPGCKKCTCVGPHFRCIKIRSKC